MRNLNSSLVCLALVRVVRLYLVDEVTTGCRLHARHKRRNAWQLRASKVANLALNLRIHGPTGENSPGQLTETTRSPCRLAQVFPGSNQAGLFTN
jgi:hypothetical protein